MKGLLSAALLSAMILSAAWGAETSAALIVPKSGTIKVAFVLSAGATVIDFAGPWEVFQDAEVPTRPRAFRVAAENAP
jgi:hypothetical protein